LAEAAHAYPEAMEGRPMTEPEVSRFWWRETGREVAGDPRGWLALMLRKAWLFWSSREEPNHLDFGFFRASSLPLSLAIVPFGLLAPLALTGIGFSLVRRPRDARVVWLAVLTAAYAAITSLFFVADRFRLPVTGWIAVLAAGTLVGILARASSERPR